VRDRHLEFFLQLAEETEPKLKGPEQTQWLDQLQQEEDNVRAALRWCQTIADGGAGLRLASVLGWFWVKRNYLEEGRAWLEEALSRGRGAPISWRVKALQWLGWIGRYQGDIPASRSLLEESLALARTAGDRRAIAWSLFQLGLAAAHLKDYERLTAVGEECLALAREIGEPWHLSHALLLLAILARERDDYPQALRLFDENLTLARQAGDKWLVAQTLGQLAIAVQYAGQPDQSTALHIEQITLGQELKANVLIAWGLEGVAAVAAGEGQAERAAHLLGAAEALFEALSAGLPPTQRVVHDRTAEAARAALGEEAFAAAWAAGRAMSLDEAVRVALEHKPTASDKV
jgi:tetratricopeptide (TPR) repeat protein